MVQCPICSTTNEDTTRFCLECGQRLEVSPSANPSSSKLQSPFFPKDPADLTNQNTDYSGTYGNSTNTVEHNPRTLNSPLLHGESNAGSANTTKRKGLHSPLLGQPEDDSYFEEAQENISSGHDLRSPLLDQASAKSKNKRPQAKKISFNPAEEESNINLEKRVSQRSAGLHSPILNSYPTNQYAEEIEPPAEQENPNILRSPLLAAKVPLTEHNFSIAQTSNELKKPAPTQSNIESPNPQATQPVINASSDISNAHTQMGSVNQSPKPTQPIIPISYLSQADIDLSTHPISKPETNLAAPKLSSGIQQSPTPLKTTDAPAWVATSTSDSEQISNQNNRRRRPKLLEDSSYETEVPYINTKLPVQSNNSSNLYQLLLIPLTVAALYKVWFISQCLNQLTLAANQACELVVIICLFVLINNLASGSKH